MKQFKLIQVACISVLMLFLANNLFAENALYIPATSISAGEAQTLSVSLKNKDEITAIQFDIKLPSGFSVNTYVNEDEETVPDIQLTERKKSKHQLSCTQMGEGSYRVVVISSTNQTFRDNDGALVNISVTASTTLSSGQYNVSLRNIHLVPMANGVQGERIDQTDCTTQITLNNASQSTDVDVQLSVSTSTLNAGVNNQTLSVALTNNIEVTAFQFDIVLPAGITVNDYVNEDDETVPNITLTSRSAKHQLSCNPYANGLYKVVVISTANKAFSGNSGNIVDLDVNIPLTMGGDYTVSLSNIHIVPLVNGTPGVRIDQSDVTHTITIVNEGGGEEEPEGSMVFFTESLNLLPGEEDILNINMNNEKSVCSFQFNLTLPEGISVVKEYNEDDEYVESINLTERKKSTHDLSVKQTEDGSYFLMSYSLSNATYRDNSGTIIKVKVKADESMKLGNYGVVISNAIMVTPDEQRYEIEDYNGTISITRVNNLETVESDILFSLCESILSVTGLSNGDVVNVYTLQGLKIASAVCTNGIVTINCKGFMENNIMIATIVRDGQTIKSTKFNL